MSKLGLLMCTTVFAAVASFNSQAMDANTNGEWISLGVPSFVHMGTTGDFYLNGTNQGMCANVAPQYFRLDMSASNFKEFYSWLLIMATTGKPIDCVVDSGCGSSQLWVHYCRGPLQ